MKVSEAHAWTGRTMLGAHVNTKHEVRMVEARDQQKTTRRMERRWEDDEEEEEEAEVVNDVHGSLVHRPCRPCSSTTHSLAYVHYPASLSKGKKPGTKR